MRDRPFISAGESPRRFSDVLEERNATDPAGRRREQVLLEIARLEADGKQLEAEALRCALAETPRR